MYQRLFEEFLAGGDSLRVYKGDKLIFVSVEDGLLPLLEYIERFAPEYRQVVMFDKIMGNAAALLSVKADCCEVFNPVGSQLAVRTLDKYGVEYHINNIVPYIQKPGQEEMCPMERLSIDKDPEEFYEAVKKVTGRP
jgi:hypothetical protein